MLNVKFEMVERLRLAGLRPTRQRLSLATILFGAGDRHVSAESLHQEAVAARMNVSLATVYNTLNQFKAAGLLREVAFEGDRTFFDTNTSNHFHYYLEETGGLVDIGTEALEVKGLPDLPPGTEIDRIDIIVRLKKSEPSSLPLVGRDRGWGSASPAASHPPPLTPRHEGEGD